MVPSGNGPQCGSFCLSGENTRVLERPMHIADRGKTKLPGNHGQFGDAAATEAYRPLRATQKVRVKPVVPRGQDDEASSPEPNRRYTHPDPASG